jgi:hypothetical protein
MKVKSSTLLATTMAAAGVMTSPALFGGAPAQAVADIHLLTSIRVLSRAPDAFRYAVTVRPVGGPARAATLIANTRRPAAWTVATPACLPSADRTALACDLGDMREQETRTLNLTARPGGPAAMPVIVQVGAANALSVTASLGAAHPTTLRLVRSKRATTGEPPPGTAPSVPAGELTSQEPSPEAQSSAAGFSPELSPPAGVSPPVGSSSAGPATSEPVASEPAMAETAIAEPGISETATPDAAKPEVGALATSSRAAHQPKPGHQRVRPTTSAGPEPAAPHAAPHPGTIGAPHGPIIPHVPVGPDLPGGAGAPPAPVATTPAAGAPAGGAPMGGPPPGGAPMGGPVPLPGASAPAVLPRIAPKTVPGEGVSELSTLSPAGAMRAGRTSWATLVAIAVVSEAGLLWLVAGFAVMRRRRRTPGVRGPRRQSPWPLISKILP